jgi:hypothetical protein
VINKVGDNMPVEPDIEKQLAILNSTLMRLLDSNQKIVDTINDPKPKTLPDNKNKPIEVSRREEPMLDPEILTYLRGIQGFSEKSYITQYKMRKENEEAFRTLSQERKLQFDKEFKRQEEENKKNKERSKGFLQRVFEHRYKGGGLLGSLTKASTSIMWDRTAGKLADDFKTKFINPMATFSNAMSGKIGIGTDEWALGVESDIKKKKRSKRERTSIEDESEFKFDSRSSRPKRKKFDPSADDRNRVSAFDFMNKNQDDERKVEKTTSKDISDIEHLFKDFSSVSSGKSLYVRIRDKDTSGPKTVAKKDEAGGSGLLGGLLGKAIPALGAGLMGLTKFLPHVAIATLAYKAVTGALDASKDGFADAQKIFNKKRHQLTTGERLSSSIGTALSSLSFGLLDKESTTKGIHKAGSEVLEKGKSGISWIQENAPGVKTANKFWQKHGLKEGSKIVGNTIMDEGIKPAISAIQENVPGVKTANKWWQKRGLMGGMSEIGGFLLDEGKSLVKSGSSAVSSLMKDDKPQATAKPQITPAVEGVKPINTETATNVNTTAGLNDTLNKILETIQKIWGSYEQGLKAGIIKNVGTNASISAALGNRTASNVMSAAGTIPEVK